MQAPLRVPLWMRVIHVMAATNRYHFSPDEIAEDLGLPRPTPVAMVLNALKKKGYVEQEFGEDFSLTMKGLEFLIPVTVILGELG